MPKYRKKPVVIEAVQLTRPMTVETLEGTMRGDPGDWLITGVAGEQYFCKPDIFDKTYELVSEGQYDDEIERAKKSKRMLEDLKMKLISENPQLVCQPFGIGIEIGDK